MVEFVKKYGWNKYSQNGEDGIIQECLKRMKLTPGMCVEFGAADGYFCSNTRLLIDKGWKSMLFDINPGNGIIKEEITPENVNKILGHHVDFLSIDVDGNDYWIWKAYNGKPKIVVIEVNSSFDPMVTMMNEGVSYRPMLELGIKKGYFLLCHTGNMVFVDKKYRSLFPEVIGDGFNHEKYFNTSWLL